MSCLKYNKLKFKKFLKSIDERQENYENGTQKKAKSIRKKVVEMKNEQRKNVSIVGFLKENKK